MTTPTDRLPNGATIIARHRDIVLAFFRSEYVTWHLNALGATTSGRYFRDHRSAQRDFAERILNHS